MEQPNVSNRKELKKNQRRKNSSTRGRWQGRTEE
jgi:hypothetical protein